MATATQNQIATSGARMLTIAGFYPSGQAYTDTVQAGSSHEAMIRVLADRRYSDDGGDLEVSSVIDAETGKVVDGKLLSADRDLLPEVEAIELVLEKVTELLSTTTFASRDSTEQSSDYYRYLAYTEYFGLVLAEAPHAFEGVSHGSGATSDEDMTLVFEDSQGLEHQFEPAVALLALAEAALLGGMTTAALQVKTLATVARGTVNLAALDALGTY
ncbi:hypothetical protein [Ralstonia pseudosolanacearum]|uniref:hypothetical protein n=1 Tax=Ralstonia pseudosolanacearum TaxID=1310165 RepID=UPI003CF5139B